MSARETKSDSPQILTTPSGTIWMRGLYHSCGRELQPSDWNENTEQLICGACHQDAMAIWRD
jgi:hypothetical protein